MKEMMAGAVLLCLAAAFAGCGGSDTTTSTAPAASANAGGPTTNASGSPSAAAPTSAPAVTGGDTCKYLSAAEASAVLANPGAVRVTSADTPAAKQTTCSWGTGATNRIILVVNVVKDGPYASAAKTAVDDLIVEKIDGLGDAGGFETKTADAVSIVFIKGSTQILLSVSATGVNASAVVAAAKKMAAGL